VYLFEAKYGRLLYHWSVIIPELSVLGHFDEKALWQNTQHLLAKQISSFSKAI